MIVLIYVIGAVSLLFYFRTQPVNFERYEKPFFPNGLVVSASYLGIYEGTPFVPTLFSNARDQSRAGLMIVLAFISVGLMVLALAPLSLLAFGSDLQEVVLMNLGSGTFSQFITFLYVVTMIFCAGMLLYPMVDIISMWVERFQKSDLLLQNSGRQFTFRDEVLMRLSILVPTFFLAGMVTSFTFLMKINGVIPANIMMNILPNYMLIKLAEEIDDKTIISKGRYHMAKILYVLGWTLVAIGLADFGNS